MPALLGHERSVVGRQGPRWLSPWQRRGLAIFAVGVVGVFGVARSLDPYDADGRPLRIGVHRQLGLPPCTFYSLTGLPCPSCGMTTSFALLARGDLKGSLGANAAGTVLAGFLIVLVPWAVLGAARSRAPVVGPGAVLTAGVIGLLAVLVVRWVILLPELIGWPR